MEVSDEIVHKALTVAEKNSTHLIYEETIRKVLNAVAQDIIDQCRPDGARSSEGDAR